MGEPGGERSAHEVVVLHEEHGSDHGVIIRRPRSRVVGVSPTGGGSAAGERYGSGVVGLGQMCADHSDMASMKHDAGAV